MAGTLVSEVILAESIIPARIFNPKCYQEGPDKYFQELADAVYALTGVDVTKQKIKEGLGVFNEAEREKILDINILNTLYNLYNKYPGLSTCADICVDLPVNATIHSVTPFVKEAWEKEYHESYFNTHLRGGQIGWMTILPSQVTENQNSKQVCAKIKNWKHDRKRLFKLVIEYSSP